MTTIINIINTFKHTNTKKDIVGGTLQNLYTCSSESGRSNHYQGSHTFAEMKFPDFPAQFSSYFRLICGVCVRPELCIPIIFL
jgi:hypothetical protein